MKARILTAARHLFGQFGYNDTTTRMIAGEVGIDISTLHYHWGEKKDLYEGVLMDVSEEIQGRLIEIERATSGKSLSTRLEIALDMMCDYLFSHPEVSNLILFGYFNKTDHGVTLDIKMARYISNIAVAMGMAEDRAQVSAQSKARILAVWNTVLNFISAENSFRPMLKTGRSEYIKVVKETLKFILVPAFTTSEPSD